MAEFREVFTNKHVVLPVIHVLDGPQAIRNTEIAQEAGADGVFLNDMDGRGSRRFLKIIESVHAEFPDYWLGANFLNEPDIIDAFTQSPPYIKGLWTDNARISELFEHQPHAQIISQARKESGWDGLYFGGVAFKYQEKVRNLAKVAKAAVPFVDVVTTSGDGTGIAANTEKIKIMKEAIGDYPLGIASGISPENIADYLPHADVFLVATSLLIQGQENFDPSRVRQLIQIVRDYSS